MDSDRRPCFDPAQQADRRPLIARILKLAVIIPNLRRNVKT
jgi:hypothetical protein